MLMKRNLHFSKMSCLKCTIQKFEMSPIKIGDFTRAVSWAILPQKIGIQMEW